MIKYIILTIDIEVSDIISIMSVIFSGFLAMLAYRQAKKANEISIKGSFIDKRSKIYIKLSVLYSIIDNTIDKFIVKFNNDVGDGVISLHPDIDSWVNSKELYPKSVVEYMSEDINYVYLENLSNEMLDSIDSELIWIKYIDLYFDNGQFNIFPKYVEKYQKILRELIVYSNMVQSYRSEMLKYYNLGTGVNRIEQIDNGVPVDWEISEVYVENMTKYHIKIRKLLSELNDIHSTISNENILSKMKDELIMK